MPPRALLLDLDGTLYEQNHPIPGAAAAIERIRAAGLGLRFVTNTTRLPRRGLLAHLTTLGFTATLDELFTAPAAAARWLQAHGVSRVAVYVPEATHEEFAAFTIDDARPDAVVVGDLGPAWTYDRLTQAFRQLLNGARLVAIQKSRYWKTADGLSLDAGPFVAALEYATGTEAVVVGKPSPEFFTAAAASLGLSPGDVAMVGDDARSDVAGAQAAGCLGILVRTGKYRAGDEDRTAQAPDAVIDSVADLPRWVLR